MGIRKVREEFEKLPDIAKRIESLEFNEYTKEYESSLMCCSNEAYVNGAWYAFQEQQKSVGEYYEISVALNTETINQRRYIVSQSAKNEELQNKINEIKAMAENWINQDYTYNSDSTDIKIQQMKDCGRDIIQKINGELK